MKPILRFAPSPTGRLHIGNVRTATLNWLFALKHSGTFILRLDDTDLERSTEENAEGIRDDLNWLGLKWTREERQSLRTCATRRRLQSCETRACFIRATRARTNSIARGSASSALHKPPIYDRSALKLPRPSGQKSKPRGVGRIGASVCPIPPLSMDCSSADHRLVARSHSRRSTVDLGSLSDPVLIRADGTFLYTFTSVVDDIEFGITHIVRGEDHVTNTGVQMADIRGSGRGSSGVRASFLDRCRRAGVVEAPRRALGAEFPRRWARADGGTQPRGAGRDVGFDRAHEDDSQLARCSTSPRSRKRRDASTSRN